ncbi:hypothetical protein CUR95_24005 [Bordetella bronchiseptica]|nr:hypothetical protein [Bordetella bronchiseptica]
MSTNPIQARYQTLGELRRRLRARLGFIISGPAAENNREVLNDFLLDAHTTICEEVEVSVMRKRTEIQLSAGSVMYDWHNDIEDEDIDPSNVLAVHVIIGDTMRPPLVQGICEADREQVDLRSWPERYDTMNGQIELWPAPDQGYRLVIEYTASPARFVQDADRPAVPDHLVFGSALAMAKAHYRHPDAQAVAAKFERALSKYKAKQFENRRIFAATSVTTEPQVVRTANGYQLRV